MSRAPLLCAATLVACSPKPVDLALSRVLIDAPASWSDSAARKKLRVEIKERLLRDDTVEGFVPRPRATHYVRVRILATVERDDGPLVPIEVTLSPSGDAPEFSALGEGVPTGDLVAGVVVGFEAAWKTLIRMRTLHASKDSALTEALGDADPQIRYAAATYLGERKSREAVKPLIDRLGVEEREHLLLRLVGALVDIGDERAVAPLLDLTYQREPQFVLQIVYAVARLGGRTAEGFLVTLASGHPEPAIQAGAKEALEEMKRRTQAKAAAH